MDEPKNTIALNADLDERREMPRCAVDVPVTLVVLSQGSMMVGRMTELSLSGCRVQLPKSLAQAARAAVECTFKIRGVGFRLAGVVEWAVNNLAGLQFNFMSSRSRDDLVEILCEVELENNANRSLAASDAAQAPATDLPAVETILAEVAAFHPSQPRPDTRSWNPFAGMAMGAMERRPADMRAAAPRLRTSTMTPAPIQPRVSAQSVPAAAAAGAVSAPPPSPSAPNQPDQSNQSGPSHGRGRERRASRRCGVDTSALIDLVNVGSKLGGLILDLSVGGCRIKTAEKFPVGIYTRVEVEFKLHGLAFRLGGVIQAIHDRNMVGIRFLDMSQRKKDQVAELVAEMEEPDGDKAGSIQ